MHSFAFSVLLWETFLQQLFVDWRETVQEAKDVVLIIVEWVFQFGSIVFNCHYKRIWMLFLKGLVGSLNNNSN